MKGNDCVIKYTNPDYSHCTGCKSCEMLCSLFHDGVNSPERARIHLGIGPIKTMMHDIYVCQQCEDHPCYNACPNQDAAMCIDENGIVYVNKEECLGCGCCVDACPFDPPRVHLAHKDGADYAVKCDLCRGIEGGPICVNNCPAMVLGLKSQAKDDLSEPAGQ